MMGERVKDVYVMWEICEKEVYVMRDMKKCLCDGREGVPITNLPPPKRVFSPAPPSLENRKRVLPQTHKLSDYQSLI